MVKGKPPAAEAAKNIEAIYPLSPLQEGLLLHTISAPGSGVYVVQSDFTLQGNLDVPSFKLAWDRVVQRHSSLRALFLSKGRDKPLQIVRRQITLPWMELDWRRLDTAAQDRELDAYLKTERARGFDPDTAPLMHFALFHTGRGTCRFLWSFHHLLLDGWSFALVMKEVFAFYDAFSRAQDLHLDPAHPYREYIGWLQKQDMARAESFWRETLSGFAAPTPFPIGKPATERQEVPGEERGRQRLELPETTVAALRNFARERRLTLNTVLQGVWATLLSRYSGEDDVVFGVTSSGRPATLAGSESMVGLLINTLPMRARIRPDCPLVTWFEEIQAQQVDVREYEYTPLAAIQRWSDVPGGSSLFESLLAFENYPRKPVEAVRPGGLEVSNVLYHEQTHFPLSLQVLPDARLSLLVEYDADRFDDSTIGRLLGHLQTLLEGIIANPDARVCELPLLTRAEWHQAVVEWNNTATESPRDKCIHQLFEEQAARTPERVAVVFQQQRLTYRELNQRANQLAHYLRQRAVGPEVLVGICMERSVEMIVGVMGILKAGGAYVPLDLQHPQSRVAMILEDAHPTLVLTQSRFVGQLLVSGLQLVCIDAEGSAIEAESWENPILRNAPKDLAYVLYTSGSTGRPKGVAIEHRNAVAFIHWAQGVYSPEDLAGVLFSTSLCFDMSVFEIFVTLTAGGTVIGAESALESRGLPAAKKMTLINTVPSAIAELMRQGNWQAGVRTVNLAGEPLPNKLAQSVYAQSGVKNVYNLYGPTETTTYSTWLRVEKGATADPPIGRPIANTRAYVLDGRLQPVPIGVAGVLYLGGDGLARGYLDRPDLTGERFLRSPFSSDPNARLYRTGDLVRYLPDGGIEFLGRMDYQVKLRGFRIELGEIEVVLRQHPDVRDCRVFARKDEHDTKRLVAYWLPAPEATATAAELRSYLKGKLPDYMVPSVFMMLEAFPLTPNGKLDERALPVPETTPSDRQDGFVAPRTPVEKSLAAIWTQVLHLEKVGMHDNFFDLGGTSLDYFAMFNRIEQEFGRTITSALMRQAPTIEQLAGVLAHPHGVATSLPVPPRSHWLSRLVRQTRSWIASPGKTLCKLGDRMYETIVQVGPVRFRSWLPYATGTRFLARCFGYRLTQDVLFRRSLRMVRECMPSTVHQPADIYPQSLASNVWFVWRTAALAQCTSEELDRWITVTGLSDFEQAHHEGRGVVLVSSHAHMRRIIPWVLHRAGYADWGIVGIGSDDGTLKAMGLRNAVHDALQGWDVSQESNFAVQLYKAKELLERGGIVQMAPDGHIGSDAALTIPFLDRHLTLRAGFAELALTTASPVIAASVSIDVAGHMKVEFFPRFVVPDLGHRQQVESLLLQYGDIFLKEWTDNYGNVNWAYLERFCRKLFPFRQQESTHVARRRSSSMTALK